MSDINGAAPAAAEQTPIAEAEPVQVPNPIQSEGPQPDPKPEPKAEAEPKKPASVRDALEKADAKLKAEPKETKEANNPEPKAEAKDKSKVDTKPGAKDAKDAEPAESKGPNRGDDGKFASKEPKEAKPEVKDTPFREAPKRFSDDAKAEWGKAPDSIKAETHRAIREIEDGLKEYQKRWEPLKEYDQKAKEYNTSIKDALDRYTGLERRLMSPDPHDRFSAIQEVFDYAGVNMREFAAQLSGQQADQTSVHYEGQMQSLRKEISELKGRLQAYESKEQDKTMSDIDDFASAHPRFDELSPTIARFLEIGFAQNLEEAYVMADRLKPGAEQDNSESRVIPEQAPQPRTQRSIAGSPTSGSSTPQRKPSNSIREALERAHARVG